MQMVQVASLSIFLSFKLVMAQSQLLSSYSTALPQYRELRDTKAKLQDQVHCKRFGSQTEHSEWEEELEKLLEEELKRTECKMAGMREFWEQRGYDLAKDRFGADTSGARVTCSVGCLAQ